MIQPQSVRKINKRLVYWGLLGLMALAAPAVVSLASSGKKEGHTASKNKEAQINAYAVDAKAISGTEHFPDTYGDVKDFEKDLAAKVKQEEFVFAANPIGESVKSNPEISAPPNHQIPNDDVWREAQKREQKQRAHDHYDASRSDIMVINNVRRKPEHEPEGDMLKMMEQAMAMANKSMDASPHDMLLLKGGEEKSPHRAFLGAKSVLGQIKEPSKHMISEGTLLPVILLTEINTDLPGPILARISHNIWDSKTGQTLLIPQNSKLIGEYNSTIGNGQTRAQIVWTRIIYPNQQSIDLNRMVGVDKKGTSGANGTVDNHYDKVAVGLLLTTTLGAGMRMTQGKYDPNSATMGQEFGNTLAQETARLGNKITDKMLSVPPTIKVPMGERLNVFVEQDLNLQPYQG